MLLTFLLRVKLCQLVTGHPWLHEECANPLYDLTNYYRTSYDKICNPVKYGSFCQITEIKQDFQPLIIVKLWLKRRNIATQNSYNEKQNETFLIGNSGSNLTRLERMTCQSIESYFEVLSEQLFQEDYVKVTQNPLAAFQNVQYTEWYLPHRVFCEASCGVSKRSYKIFSITFEDRVSELCQFAIIVTMAVNGMIDLFIFVGNLLILIIFFRTSMLKNTPGYFILNLAISDLCVGLIIMPTVIYNRYQLANTPLPCRCNGERFGLIDFFGQR